MAFVDRTIGAKLAAEFVGTFALLFVGVMVLTVGASSGLVGAALAHGLAIGVMASATMLISGAHFNPAVTVAVWAGRRMPGVEAMAYILTQLAGASSGALLAKWCMPTMLAPGMQPFSNGIPTLGGVSVGSAILIEAILTFFLVFVVFGTGVDARFGGRLGGLAIGFAVSIGVFAGGPLTGAAMNPARWFGAALVGNQWANALVWVVGPLFGAVAASALWTYVLLPRAAARTPIDPDG